MKEPSQNPITEVSRRQAKVEMTIGIDLGDVWSHYCTFNPDGEVVDRDRFRTTPKAVEKWFTDLPPVRASMETGTHSIWVGEQLQGAFGLARGFAGTRAFWPFPMVLILVVFLDGTWIVCGIFLLC